MNVIRIIYLLGLVFFSGHSFSQHYEYLPHSKVAALFEYSEIYPDTKNTLGLLIELDQGWHTYWRNPGNTGAPANVRMTSSLYTIKQQDTIWPKPIRIESGKFVSFAFEKKLFLQVPFFIDPSAKVMAKEIPIEVQFDYLVCQNECVPVAGVIHAKLNVLGAYPKQKLSALRFFEESRMDLPSEDLIRSGYTKDQDQIRIRINQNQKLVGFFPYEKRGIDPIKIQISDYSVTLQVNNDFVSGYSGPLGLAVLKSDSGKEISKEIFVNPLEKKNPYLFLLLAFLGGLLLNAMPCVLPVVSLKFFTLLKLSPESLRKNCVMYSLGVVASMLFLCIIFIAFQFSGSLIGWGFQMQSPVFVASMFVLFFLISLNFLGVFEVSLPLMNRVASFQSKHSSMQELLSGVLAVFVAAPCTAPMMGAALGFSIAQNYFVQISIFLSLGLGLAFPFILLLAFPKGIHFLPKPGKWMVSFRKWMALPMLLTCAWLAFVFSSLLSQRTNSSNVLSWKEYRLTELNQLLESQKSVFVDFTAQWCLTCKVNEATTLERQVAKQLFEKYQVTLLKADWTQKNEEITQALLKYQRIGIPLYLLFVKGNPNPIILPEVLTLPILEKALTQAFQGSS